MSQIKYTDGWLYRLELDYQFQVDITGYSIKTNWLEMDTSGLITLNRGYCWDGATWCPEFKTIRRGSLEHDALYQLMQLGLLPSSYKKLADKHLIKTCKEDGMNGVLRKIVYQAVKMGGDTRKGEGDTVRVPKKAGRNG